jgi:hypothetical protein
MLMKLLIKQCKTRSLMVDIPLPDDSDTTPFLLSKVDVEFPDGTLINKGDIFLGLKFVMLIDVDKKEPDQVGIYLHGINKALPLQYLLPFKFSNN